MKVTAYESTELTVASYLVKTGSCDWMTCTLTMTSSRVLMTSTMSFSNVCRRASGKPALPWRMWRRVSRSSGKVN